MKSGIHLDVEAAAYHADPCPEPSFTQSIGKVLLDASPAHARLAHPRLTHLPAEPEEYSAVRVIGDAAHALLIGRGKRVVVGEWENWRSKPAQEFRDRVTGQGHIAILPKHQARAIAMVRAALEQLEDVGLSDAFSLTACHGEVVLAWQENGLWLRTMIDCLSRDRHIVLDYKTSGMSCAPHAVEDRPSVMGWDIQAAMHERGLDALDAGNAGRRFHYYVNQENEEPYALTVVEISEADMTMGRKKLAMAFDIWSRCMRTDKWPRYPAETILSRPRGYLETKFLEREIAHAERKPAGRYATITELSGG